MHTILLTRIFQTSSDELQRFNLVQSHLGDFSSGITLWYHPLTTTDDGDVLSLLCSVKVDTQNIFRSRTLQPRIYRPFCAIWTSSSAMAASPWTT